MLSYATEHLSAEERALVRRAAAIMVAAMAALCLVYEQLRHRSDARSERLEN